MLKIATLIPRYRKLHKLLSQLSKTSSLTFEQQQFVCDFYSDFSDLEAIEQMLISLLETHSANSHILIKSLQTEVQNCIEVLNSYPFTHLDIKEVCNIFSKQYDNRISHQLAETNKLSKELNSINGSLDAIGFREHSQQEEKRLWDKHEEITKKYNAEKQLLNSLYDRKEEAIQIACKYQKNHFPLLLSLSLNIEEILGKYTEKENIGSNVELFPMELIANIYNLCKEQQFETVSATEFYATLNNPTSSMFLKVKRGERIRVCYLIYKLYDSLTVPNKADWRKQILKALNIDESFYNSKYKNAGLNSASDKSFEFARQLDKLFV